MPPALLSSMHIKTSTTHLSLKPPADTLHSRVYAMQLHSFSDDFLISPFSVLVKWSLFLSGDECAAGKLGPVHSLRLRWLLSSSLTEGLHGICEIPSSRFIFSGRGEWEGLQITDRWQQMTSFMSFVLPYWSVLKSLLLLKSLLCQFLFWFIIIIIIMKC